MKYCLKVRDTEYKTLYIKIRGNHLSREKYKKRETKSGTEINGK
jgi:hypothetical protein